MRIYMAVVHMGARIVAGVGSSGGGGTKNVGAQKKSRYERSTPSQFAYIKSTRCVQQQQQHKKNNKKENIGERRNRSSPTGAARMTINLHRIMMHVLIKNWARRWKRRRQNGRYYVWVFRVPIRIIIPGIRVMHARKQRVYMYLACLRTRLYVVSDIRIDGNGLHSHGRKIGTAVCKLRLRNPSERLLYAGESASAPFFVCSLECMIFRLLNPNFLREN